MTFLLSKDEIKLAINDHINQDGVSIFKTPLVNDISQYPFSNMIFVNNQTDDDTIQTITEEIKKTNQLKNQFLIQKFERNLSLTYVNGPFAFLKNEIKNSTLMHLIKFIF